VLEECATIGGEARPGDQFLLMTDSPARWFLEVVEAGGRPWDVLLGLADSEEFAAFIAGTRQGRAMRNDDVTLMVFTVPERLPAPPAPLVLPPPAMGR
jgi:hypothetical protein